MADKSKKWPENAAGKYYVDDACIDCGVCCDMASEHFKRHEDGGYSIVYKQPASAEEIEECEQAKESCPVNAIGNDGE